MDKLTFFLLQKINGKLRILNKNQMSRRLMQTIKNKGSFLFDEFSNCYADLVSCCIKSQNL
jgi:tartrate dehydratase beta subunit/fumarate hydratase class I family protein